MPSPSICGMLKSIMEKLETRIMMMFLVMREVAKMDPLKMMFHIAEKAKDFKVVILSNN